MEREGDQEANLAGRAGLQVGARQFVDMNCLRMRHAADGDETVVDSVPVSVAHVG